MESANPTVNPTGAISQQDIKRKTWGSDSLHIPTIIAYSTLITVFFVLIQLAVWPIKKDIAKIEGRLSQIGAGQVELKERMDKLETGQMELKTDITEIKQLLKNQK